MPDPGKGDKMKEGVVELAQTTRGLMQALDDMLVAAGAPNGEFEMDLKTDEGQREFLSLMAHSIGTFLGQQRGAVDMANAWMRLSQSLSDVNGGKAAELFRPAEVTGRRQMSVHYEMSMAIAAAIYDMSPRGEKRSAAKELADTIGVKPSAIENFRKELTRGKSNIKSREAFDLFNSVKSGRLRVDRRGQLITGKGGMSSRENWLLFFKGLPPHLV